MNAEVIKAMNKKESKVDVIRKWWSKNGYKVMRVVLFPVWAYVWTKDKVTNYLNSRHTWSEERANEILNYYVPRRAEWCADDNTFYFFDNGYGWSISLAKRYLKRKDRRFWSVNNGWTGGSIRRYLIDTFALEGFTKEIGYCEDGRTEITFKMIER